MDQWPGCGLKARGTRLLEYEYLQSSGGPFDATEVEFLARVVDGLNIRLLESDKSIGVAIV